MAKIFGEGRAEFSDGADSEEGNVELNAYDKGSLNLHGIKERYSFN